MRRGYALALMAILSLAAGMEVGSAYDTPPPATPEAAPNMDTYNPIDVQVPAEYTEVAVLGLDYILILISGIFSGGVTTSGGRFASAAPEVAAPVASGYLLGFPLRV